VRQQQSGPAIFWSVATVAGAAGTVGFLVMGVVSLNRPISEKVTGQVHPYVGPGAAGVEGTF